MINLLRWIAFFPIAYALLAISNLGLIFVVSGTPWWLAGLLFLFIGLIAAEAITVWAISVTPTPRIGAIVFIVMVIFYQSSLIVSGKIDPTVDNGNRSVFFWIVIFGLKLIHNGWRHHKLFSLLKQSTGKEFGTEYLGSESLSESETEMSERNLAASAARGGVMDSLSRGNALTTRDAERLVEAVILDGQDGGKAVDISVKFLNENGHKISRNEFADLFIDNENEDEDEDEKDDEVLEHGLQSNKESKERIKRTDDLIARLIEANIREEDAKNEFEDFLSKIGYSNLLENIDRSLATERHIDKIAEGVKEVGDWIACQIKKSSTGKITESWKTINDKINMIQYLEKYSEFVSTIPNKYENKSIRKLNNTLQEAKNVVLALKNLEESERNLRITEQTERRFRV